MQALTDGGLLSIPIEDYSSLSAGDPCWDKIINKLLIQLFIEMDYHRNLTFCYEL